VTSSPAKVRILLVEDNPADVYLMRQALNEASFAHELTVSTDGDDALQLLRGQGANGSETMPQLVLLDLNLPRVDGPAILDAVRAETRLQNLPIVLLSSSQAPRDKARAATLRHGLYLVKPADLDEYLALGRRIYDFWCECSSDVR
jgi:two-component system, chemotaxis family, response regulator Rcp1